MMVFGTFLGVSLLLQLVFFDRFYVHNRRDVIQDGIEHFVAAGLNDNSGSFALYNSMVDFTNECSAQLVVLDAKRGMVAGSSVEWLLTLDDGKQAVMEVDPSGLISRQRLRPGAEFEIRALPLDAGHYQPIRITMVKGRRVIYQTKMQGASALTSLPDSFWTGAVMDNDAKRGKHPADSIEIPGSEIIHGRLTGIRFTPSLGDSTSHEQETLWAAVDTWFQSGADRKVKDDRIRTFQYSNSYQDMDSILLVRPVTKHGNVRQWIFATASLEPVAQSWAVMKNYNAYVLTAGILCLLLVTIVYSRLIARPLIHLNQIADRMARLDFSIRSRVTSKDELGSLAISLNALGDRLGQSLDELQSANAKLNADMEQERRIARARSDFVSGISHELKTPVSIIRGYAEMLSGGLSADKAHHYANVIFEESQRLDTMLSDMLDHAMLESGNYNLNKQAFIINELISDLIEKLAYHTRRDGIQVTFLAVVEKIRVEADKKRIEQVLINLLSNAIRHTGPNGAIEIMLETRYGNAWVSIENCGSPIPENKLTEIWNAFYRTEESRDRRMGGTGLGLSVVKNILTLHESEFGARNTDSGVAFFFSLNLASRQV